MSSGELTRNWKLLKTLLWNKIRKSQVLNFWRMVPSKDKRTDQILTKMRSWNQKRKFKPWNKRLNVLISTIKNCRSLMKNSSAAWKRRTSTLIRLSWILKVKFKWYKNSSLKVKKSLTGLRNSWQLQLIQRRRKKRERFAHRHVLINQYTTIKVTVMNLTLVKIITWWHQT